MARTMIDLDDEALAEAAKVLGTTSKKDTVNKALREAVARIRRLEGIMELHEMSESGELDLGFLEELQAAEKAVAERAAVRGRGGDSKPLPEAT